MQQNPLIAKTAIITGASSGIGREIALQIAEHDVCLALASRNEKALDEVANECRKRGGFPVVIPTDVRNDWECRRLVREAAAAFGRIDILFNCAGVNVLGDLEQLSNVRRVQSMIETNLIGSIQCAYYALPHLRKMKGRIVSVSSILGKVPMPGYAAYCASKYAMAGFFDSLRIELKGSGVSVTTVYPGVVATDFAQRMVQPNGKPLGKTGELLYGRRAMRAEACASLILDATAKRKRQVIMTPEGKLSVWMNFLMPRLWDRVSTKARKVMKKRINEA